MKKSILATAAFAALTVAASAQVHVAITEGNSALLAGFDFNGTNGSFTSINARYSDLWSPAQNATATGNTGDSDYGTLHFTTNGGTYASSVIRATSAGNFDIDRQILTRTGGVDLLGELSGGDGSFSLNSLAKELRHVVPQTAVGLVTKPVKMADGFHIVKVLEAKAGDFASLPKERKEALRGEMISSELEKRMAMWLERKKGEANIQMLH